NVVDARFALASVADPPHCRPPLMVVAGSVLVAAPYRLRPFADAQACAVASLLVFGRIPTGIVHLHPLELEDAEDHDGTHAQDQEPAKHPFRDKKTLAVGDI